MPQEFVLNNKLNTKKFGFDKIYTVYYKPNLTDEKIEKQKIRAVIIENKDLGEARKMINKLDKIRGIIIIVKGGDNEFNRKILEDKRVDVLLSPETGKREKTKPLKQRDSGLNHVLCKIAKDNNISIAINIGDIIERSGRQRAELLTKIIQNINLCKKKKSGANIILTTLASKPDELRDIRDMKSLGISLGMPTQMAKRAVEKDFL